MFQVHNVRRASQAIRHLGGPQANTGFLGVVVWVVVALNTWCDSMAKLLWHSTTAKTRKEGRPTEHRKWEAWVSNSDKIFAALGTGKMLFPLFGHENIIQLKRLVSQHFPKQLVATIMILGQKHYVVRLGELQKRKRKTGALAPPQPHPIEVLLLLRLLLL